ncbi:MAG TPA: hypothetical protein VFX03_09015, partial [Thermomicrobiales bacterium]|nr:hypothetical protein [Thermomicrobiales bacterium]
RGLAAARFGRVPPFFAQVQPAFSRLVVFGAMEYQIILGRAAMRVNTSRRLASAGPLPQNAPDQTGGTS